MAMPIRFEQAWARWLAAPLLVMAGVAGATTFVVTNTDDAGTGSLRQAIIDANNDAGAPHTIDFAIPGAGPHTIEVASQFPSITRSMTIDGYSQPDSAMNTNVPEQGGLNAVLQVEVAGLGGYLFILGAPNDIVVTIQGLAIHGFDAPIVGVGGNGGTSQLDVFGNYLGTTIEGTSLGDSAGNGTADVLCPQSPVQVGGQLPWQRNLISGAGGPGLRIGGPAVVEGNLIGTDASGTQAVPNGVTGNNSAIAIDSYRGTIRIGGAQAEARNLISGNHTWAIGIGPTYGTTGHTGLEIKGNYIGTDLSGQRGLPNGWENPVDAQYGGGIQIYNNATAPDPLVIGGFSEGEANLIAYNRGAGIAVTYNRPGENFDSQGNMLFSNHGVGGANIDIGAPGKTANDAGDADSGANAVQNWPEVLSASLSGNQLTVTYRVDSATENSVYPLRIDFYADIAGGSGTWLTQDSYPESSAQLPRTVTLLVPAGVRAIPFVATATDAGGRTSELSPAFDVIFEDGFE